MDIYIKSFNRAYLLHRTIASIYQFLKNFDGRIIVLDDGTPKKYLDKIQKLYPEIEIVKSSYYAEKSKAILQNEIPKKVIPAMFWKEEMLKGSERFILLEDDMWFTKTINYTDFKQNIDELKMDMVNFMWLKNKNLISDNIVTSSKYFNVTKPNVFTKNSVLFNTIFRTNKLKIGSIIKRLTDYNKELLTYYQLYNVAGGVFSKRYYNACWNLHQNNVDELNQIRQLLKSKIPTNVGNTKEEIIKATYKTTATLISKEHLEATVDIFKINQILNEQWLQGNTYPINDFVNNIPNEWIKNSIKNQTTDNDLFDKWKTWYEAFKLSYTKIDCDVE